MTETMSFVDLPYRSVEEVVPRRRKAARAAPASTSPAYDFERLQSSYSEYPQILRVVKKYLRDSNWFLVTLEKKQKGDHPVPAEINEAHKDMVQSCSTDQCRAQANELKAASMRVYEINRKWGKAGCKGRLDD